MIISNDELRTLLLQNKILDEKKFAQLEKYCKNANIPIEHVIVFEQNLITDEKLGEMIAAYLKVPFINLSKTQISADILPVVPQNYARRYRIVPFEINEQSVKIATSDIRNTEIFELLQAKTGKKIEVYYATDKDIISVNHLYKKDLQKTINKLLAPAGSGPTASYERISIFKVVNTLIDFAYQDKASDIHVEPQEDNLLVRFRIDGILHDVLYLPKEIAERVITLIKVMSKLRTDEHFAAQDGKIRLKIDDINLDIRVSILPISDGEKIVMRLLTSQADNITLTDLGMSEQDLAKVNNAFNKSYGMVLSTGPTGSGKSTSIYAILKILNVREKNITTIEDPVEYKVKGLNQIQVNTKTNLTFAQGLRSILRQDPNIVFVGEIRDPETAGIAVNAALTGHLVFSTLHTNDAATSLPRLSDMNVEPYLIASTVNVIIAQRLVRKICDQCKKKTTAALKEISKSIPPAVLKKHFGSGATATVYKGEGCKVCHMSGYYGRIGVFEVLEVSRAVRKLIIEKADADIIEQQARKEGMNTMLENGLDKVKEGLTTFEEVLRVTKTETS